MAVHKFLLKTGKGLQTIDGNDLELIATDQSEEFSALRDRIWDVREEVLNKIENDVLIGSAQLEITFNIGSIRDRLSYKLSYSGDDQDIQFIFGSVQGVLNTVKHAHINTDTDNTVNFVGGQTSIQIIVPEGKLPSVTGTGKTVHAQALRTPDSKNLVYLTGDLDNAEIAGEQVSGIVLDESSPNPVTKIWSGTQAQYDAIPTKENTTLYFIVQAGNNTAGQ